MTSDKKRTILIVDDDPSLLEVLGRKLKATGFHVLTADNGVKAIDLAKMKQPDLIIMDLIMPVMGGAAALIALKDDKETSRIPIFILSGADLEAEGLDPERIGFDIIFHKPFRFADLMSRIQDVLKEEKK
jgi:CheY-like chemotaxis protein